MNAIAKHGFCIRYMTSVAVQKVGMLSQTYRRTPMVVLPLSLSRRSVSSYEFPNRTEAPIVTHTLASETYCLGVEDDDIMTNKEYNDSSKYLANNTTAENSAMSNITSPDEKEKDKCRWLDSIMENSSGIQNRTMNTCPISLIVPDFVPPNLPRELLLKPMTHITTLSNGVRVTSQETYGQVCTVGLLSSCGSRFESSQEGTTGVNHLMEIMAFHGTPDLSFHDFISKMDNLGGMTYASSSREHFMYCADVLRPNAKEAMLLLGEAVLNPRLDEVDVEQAKQVVEWQWADVPPEIKLGEGLQIAGYGPIEEGGGKQQQLGMPHLCPLEALPNVTPQTIKNFREKHLLNPHKMVIAGAGIGHEELVHLAKEVFGHITYSATKSSSKSDRYPHNNETASTVLADIVPSVYTGGEYRLSTPSVDGFTRVGLAFPTGGWFSSDLVPACILQTLLGGGSSFSAGGPGKGMYSRLYREVLNRYYWVEFAEAFTSLHSEAGLIGISGSSEPSKSRDLMRVFADHFMRLMSEDVSDEELNRARNMLKCNVLSHLESRLVLFEDLGRQILTYGKREQTDEMCQKIDDITKGDIRNFARKVMLKNDDSDSSSGCSSDGRRIKKNKPTLCVVGNDVDGVPTQEEVAEWFSGMV